MGRPGGEKSDYAVLSQGEREGSWERSTVDVLGGRWGKKENVWEVHHWNHYYNPEPLFSSRRDEIVRDAGWERP